MDRQEVIVRNAKLAWEEYLKTLDLKGGAKLVPIGGFPAYLDSLVSEDVRNHHRGVCFRVNKTDVSEDEPEFVIPNDGSGAVGITRPANMLEVINKDEE